MKKYNWTILVFFGIFLSSACSTDSPEMSDKPGGYRSADAIAHWGSEMMDDQGTSYQNLYLQLTKLEGTNQDGELVSQLNVWLEGSTQSAEAVANGLQLHYCLTEDCDFSDLSIEACKVEQRSSTSGIACLAYLPLSLDELEQTGSSMLLKANYCDEVCTESKLEYTSSDETLTKDNKYSGPGFVK